MNGFELHNIAHLSASTINLFAAEPALFVMEKLLKRRGGGVGAAAHRGTASESGVAAGLLDHSKSVEDCQQIALVEFDRLTALSADTRKAKERDAVPGIVATGLAELRAYGVPDVQVKIKRRLPGVPVPFIGYIDFRFNDVAITVDMKSQLRLSSEISAAHARQVSLYVTETNNEGRLAYVTPAKIGVYRLNNVASHIADVVNIAQRMERFLSLSPDPQVLAGVLVPNTDSFYYSDQTTRAICREVYGL